MAKQVTPPSPLNTRTATSILRLPGVIEHTGLSRSSIYSGVKHGTFPPPIRLGERAVGWLASEIMDWIESRKVARQEVEA
jgi:prophage regulatory protein